MQRLFWRIIGVVLLPLFLVCFSWVPTARATSDASVQTFHPAIDASKYFSVYGSQGLQQKQFRVGAYFNYGNDPLEFGIGGARAVGIVNHLFMADFFFSYGFFDWFQAGVNVPVALWDQVTSNILNPVGAPNRNLARMGDIRLEFKFRLINDFRYPVGLAIRPFITFPTGDGDVFVGNDSFTGGAALIFDFDIMDRAFISLNVGYLARDNVAPVGLNIEEDDKFTYGLGINIRAVEWLDVIAELYGSTLTGELFHRETEAPFEALGGLRIYPPFLEGLQISVGGGAGITFGYGTPDFRGLLEVSYLKPRVVDLPPAEPPPPVIVTPRKILITEKIHFEFDKARIRPISFHILDAVVDVLQRNPDILKVQVEGHTDAVGSDAYNQRLSERRSKSVVEYLASHGVSRSRLVAKGLGESNPVDTNDTALGRARNRRTEFTILDRAGGMSPPVATGSTY